MCHRADRRHVCIVAPLRAQTDAECSFVASVAASLTPPAATEPFDARLILSRSPFDPGQGDPELVEGSKDARDFSQVVQPPAGPPPTPRHTDIKAMLKGLGTDVKNLPSRQNRSGSGSEADSRLRPIPLTMT